MDSNDIYSMLKTNKKNVHDIMLHLIHKYTINMLDSSETSSSMNRVLRFDATTGDYVLQLGCSDVRSYSHISYIVYNDTPILDRMKALNSRVGIGVRSKECEYNGPLSHKIEPGSIFRADLEADEATSHMLKTLRDIGDEGAVEGYFYKGGLKPDKITEVFFLHPEDKVHGAVTGNEYVPTSKFSIKQGGKTSQGLISELADNICDESYTRATNIVMEMEEFHGVMETIASRYDGAEAPNGKRVDSKDVYTYKAEMVNCMFIMLQNRYICEPIHDGHVIIAHPYDTRTIKNTVIDGMKKPKNGKVKNVLRNGDSLVIPKSSAAILAESGVPKYMEIRSGDNAILMTSHETHDIHTNLVFLACPAGTIISKAVRHFKEDFYVKMPVGMFRDMIGRGRHHLHKFLSTWQNSELDVTFCKESFGGNTKRGHAVLRVPDSGQLVVLDGFQFRRFANFVWDGLSIDRDTDGNDYFKAAVEQYRKFGSIDTRNRATQGKH